MGKYFKEVVLCMVVFLVCSSFQYETPEAESIWPVVLTFFAPLFKEGVIYVFKNHINKPKAVIKNGKE